MADKITIGTSLDTSEVDKKLTELQRKIKNMRELGPTGAISQLAQTYRSSGQEERAKRLEDFRERQSSINRKEVQRDLAQQQNKLESLTRHYNNIQKGLDSLKKGTDDWNSKLEHSRKVFEDIQKTASSIGVTQKELGADLNGRGLPGLPYTQQQGMGPFSAREMTHIMRTGIGGVGRVLNPLNALGLAASGVGAAGLGMQTYGNFQYFRAGLPAAQAGRGIDITRGTNQLAERAIKGQSFDDIIFAPERARALDKTFDFFQEADSARQTRARGKFLGIAGSALTGMVLGGVKGSVGGLPGALVGGAIGLGTGMGLFGDEESYYGLTGNTQALQQMSAEDAIKKYETFKMSERLRDPRGYLQKKFLGENREGLLGIQRSTGFTDREMFGPGGFSTAYGNEFLFSQRANMQQQIVGAGGSGQAGTGETMALALRAQRMMGLTNSGQAMGRLSSYLTQEESKEAFVKILAQGVTIGLDDSEFREEQKDYFNQVTSIAQSIGGGEESVAAFMTAALEGDISRRGVSQAAEGFGNIMSKMSERGGVIAASRAAMISQSDTFNNIGGMYRVAFQNMDVRDITADNPAMKMYHRMSKSKKSLDEFVAERRDIALKSLFMPFSNTEEGKEVMNLYERSKEGQLEPDEQSRLEQLIGTFADMQGLSEERRRAVLGAFGGQRNLYKRIRETKAARKRQTEIDKARKEAGLLGTEEEASGVIRRNRDVLGEVFKDVTGRDISFTDDKANVSTYNPAQDELVLSRKDKARLGHLNEAPSFFDKQWKAGAISQNQQFSGLDKTVQDMASSVFDNLDRTLTDKIKMDSFREALESGARAVEGFMTALGYNKRKVFNHAKGDPTNPLNQKNATARAGSS